MGYKWVTHTEDKNLPAWILDNLKSHCPHCNSIMENYYTSDGRCTNRRCSNPNCPIRIARKIEAMIEILNESGAKIIDRTDTDGRPLVFKVEGVGEKTCEKFAYQEGVIDHFSAFDMDFLPPCEVDMVTFMRLCFIKGIDQGWRVLLSDYTNIETFLDEYKGKYRSSIDAVLPTIRHGLSVLKILDTDVPIYECLVSGGVMMTGDLNYNLKNRESFIHYLNKEFKGLVRLEVVKSKRKSNVLALIKEESAIPRGKVEFAIANGIPIMTPDEFIAYLGAKILERRSV